MMLVSIRSTSGSSSFMAPPHESTSVVSRISAPMRAKISFTREHVSRSPHLKRHDAPRLAQIDRQIDAIEVERKVSLSSEPDLAARFNVLVSIRGIGEITVIAMLIDLPKLGALDSKQVASLAGLAPIARDSGQHRGKRHIRGGRAAQNRRKPDPKARLITTDTPLGNRVGRCRQTEPPLRRSHLR